MNASVKMDISIMELKYVKNAILAVKLVVIWVVANANPVVLLMNEKMMGEMVVNVKMDIMMQTRLSAWFVIIAV